MRNRLHKLRGISLAIVLISMTLSACVTQKKKGEVSKAAKFYHNTTALYNGYFNARELMDESILSLQEQEKDNYNDILAIYPESKVGNPEVVAEDLNKAIEKVSIVATLHEPSKWVDDCYVLLGQAQYFQQDFETAQETFEYFIEEFDPSNTRRKKRKSAKKKKKGKKKKSSGAKKKTTKKKKKPGSKKKKKSSKKKKPGSKKKKTTKKKETPEQKTARLDAEKKRKEEAALKAKKEAELIEIDRGTSGVFKHPNAFPEGLLWLSRTYVEREKYNLTEFYLNKIYDQTEVPEKVLKEIPVVKAYSALDQKNYAAAIVHLGEAIPMEKEKKRKARLIFIQSQLYQKVGQKAEAFEGFNKVIAMKPDFLMEFNAGLNMLKSSMASGSETIASVQKKLEKMLKEDKNINFRDQIYYTLGEINYERNDLDQAIPNYRKAIQYNLDNNAQLVESYYVLAQIFYDQEDYVLSKNYYDSTSTAMSKSDERFFQVQSYSDNLTAIASNINIIKLQDSLIMLSELTPEERMEIAKNIKKEQLIAEADAAKAKAANGLGDPAFGGSAGNLRVNAIGRGGPIKPSFWAYDENKVQAGKRAFEKKYGFRQLSDDWRRSNKSSGLDDIQDISADDEVDITEDEANAILKDVPLTPDALAQTKTKLRTALFELGVLFREKIQNYKKSIEVHERLQQNYPGSEKEPDALYYLYLSHLDIKDNVKADYYLNLLKSKYPQEKYTLALTDPDYAENFMKESQKQERLYNQTYEKFTSGDYPAVLSMEMEAREKFSEDNTFGSKYALLSAMSTGKIEGKDKYISALKKMIATYPNTPEQTRAKEILRFLSGDQEAFADINEAEALEDFKSNDDKLHYVIIVINSQKDSDLNNAKISISNYNKKYHKVYRIKVSSSVLNKDNDVEVILLRKFGNKEKAMKYYNEILRNKKEFMEPKVNYTPFAITQQNFREIMKKKSIKEYEVFFEDKYL